MAIDDRAARPDELGVLVAAGDGEPERLLLLGTPHGGRVHIREWSSHNWAGPADERDDAVADALAVFQRAYDARRRMSAGLPEIRAWLAGRR
ncbi:MAG TPA: hypothetical protein VLD17_10680 [Gemmatimonadaceae bacterium]|jgi:hypothetical protein|nr:hypothetical protein [Gemmatimonadaceae bacterium]